LDRVRSLAAEDGEREGAYALMGGRELAGQTRVDIRAAKTSLTSASAAIPTTIAAPRLAPAKKTLCGESICVTATKATVYPDSTAP
jgi:hypothetical protein